MHSTCTAQHSTCTAHTELLQALGSHAVLDAANADEPRAPHELVTARIEQPLLGHVIARGQCVDQDPPLELAAPQLKLEQLCGGACAPEPALAVGRDALLDVCLVRGELSSGAAGGALRRVRRALRALELRTQAYVLGVERAALCIRLLQLLLSLLQLLRELGHLSRRLASPEPLERRHALRQPLPLLLSRAGPLVGLLERGSVSDCSCSSRLLSLRSSGLLRSELLLVLLLEQPQLLLKLVRLARVRVRVRARARARARARVRARVGYGLDEVVEPRCVLRLMEEATGANPDARTMMPEENIARMRSR